MMYEVEAPDGQIIVVEANSDDEARARASRQMTMGARTPSMETGGALAIARAGQAGPRPPLLAPQRPLDDMAAFEEDDLPLMEREIDRNRYRGGGFFDFAPLIDILGDGGPTMAEAGSGLAQAARGLERAASDLPRVWEPSPGVQELLTRRNAPQAPMLPEITVTAPQRSWGQRLDRTAQDVRDFQRGAGEVVGSLPGFAEDVARAPFRGYEQAAAGLDRARLEGDEPAAGRAGLDALTNSGMAASLFAPFAAGGLRAAPSIAARALPEAPPFLAAAGTAGLGALALGEANAEENAPLDDAQTEVARLEEIERKLTSGSVLDKQNALVELGYNVTPDGRMGPQTEGYIERARRELGPSLVGARERRDRLEADEAEQAHADFLQQHGRTAAEEGLREMLPNAVGLGMTLLGGPAARWGVTKLAGRHQLEVNRGLNKLTRPASGRNASRRTAANLNKFYAEGLGEGPRRSRVPFEPADTSLGFRPRPDADVARASELYPAPQPFVRSPDVGLVGSGVLDVAITHPLAEAKREQVAEAEAAYRADQSDANYLRLQSLKDELMWLDTAWRAGAGFAGGYALSAPKFTYGHVRPDTRAAETQVMNLRRSFAPPPPPPPPVRRTRKPKGGAS